ncbi:MOSC domain-containing protein [Paenibacillus sepulcri]|uniref:MOSC domain-containing protein n=1 Tax=Paenibacillus sepulcri TaxID=359917 RepID=A0ABS7CBP6_9BACL|nr:MOSC domain-containing protein [Paenibacillus sepulcri]
MNRQTIGHVAQITRYPVKSMAGEHLNHTHIAAYGLYGDRSHAFIDDSKEGWDRYFTARQLPVLLGYKASFTASTAQDEFPPLRITSPDGREFSWDGQLLQEIQSASRPGLSMIRHEPDSRELLAVDTGGILIITDRTLRKLGKLLGKELDPRRFRANLMISLNDDDCRDDASLIGKRLSVGSAVLEVAQECERCSVITIDPDTYEREVRILKTVKEEMNLKFGVYASVVQTGGASRGDNGVHFRVKLS